MHALLLIERVYPLVIIDNLLIILIYDVFIDCENLSLSVLGTISKLINAKKDAMFVL